MVKFQDKNAILWYLIRSTIWWDLNLDHAGSHLFSLQISSLFVTEIFSGHPLRVGYVECFEDKFFYLILTIEEN